jgi:hypothetical protein
MFSTFTRNILATKNRLDVVIPITISDLEASCRETGACNDSLLCEVELFVPIFNQPPGAYITISVVTNGGATVTVVEPAAENAKILFSNNGIDTNFVSFNIEVRDSGGNLLSTRTFGLSNSSSEIKTAWAALPTCAVDPFIIINPTFYSTNYLAALFEIQITSNTTWRVSEAPDVDWVSFTIISGGTGGNAGSGNGIVRVGVLQNPINNNGRVAYINVGNTIVEPDIIRTCTIEQTADPNGSGGNP